MTEKKTDQLNFYATPIETIDRFNNFEHNYKKIYKSKASRSAIGSLVLELGMDVGEKEIQEKLKNQKND